MDVGWKIAFLGLIKWRTKTGTSAGLTGTFYPCTRPSLQARTRQLPHSQGDPSAVTASQAMTVCQILDPLDSPGKDRLSVTNPLSLLCSSCRKFSFFPLFSRWFQNFSFCVNVSYCPTCFFWGDAVLSLSSVCLNSNKTRYTPSFVTFLYTSE